ncbi:hypothetical protein EZV62_008664 [Acer yangbiense]|uniref:Uncharacterized protein n=1 Tax=Acer yangbiense TaxID=1000413 RepID=A0A5C7IEJ1_9ROSI|nr:hypothetical protein EZV62_008664 [Acer yangbiense]
MDPRKVLDSMRYEEMKMFNQPFRKKSKENFMNLSAESYRWGNPIATCLRQLSWSKAFHISLTDISRLDNVCNNSRSAINGLFLEKAAGLAQRLAEVLAQNLGLKSSYFQENCVGALQLMKDVEWLNVKPNPEVLIVNIVKMEEEGLSVDVLWTEHYLDLHKGVGGGLSVGLHDEKENPDGVLLPIFGVLLSASDVKGVALSLSNGVYKSIEHIVIAHLEVERFSMAYFYSPSNEAVIESCSHPTVYRKFSFGEYKQQIQMDVRATGDKVGLSRFLL